MTNCVQKLKTMLMTSVMKERIFYGITLGIGSKLEEKDVRGIIGVRGSMDRLAINSIRRELL